MARTINASILAILIAFAFSGCGDSQARIGLRNAAVAAKSLESHEDAKVRAVGQAIEQQVTAAADQADERFYGLYTDRSVASIRLEDWEESWNSSLRRSLLQADAIRQETKDNKAIVDTGIGLLGQLGFPVGGTTIGVMLVWLLKNRKDLKDALVTAVNYGNEVAPAKTDEAVEEIQDKYSKLANPVLKDIVAKYKPRNKV